MRHTKTDENTVLVVFPCPDHVSRKLVLRLTGLLWERPGGGDGIAPVKLCAGCRRLLPVPSFLGNPVVRGDGYLWLTTVTKCHRCEPPAPVPLHHDSAGRLRMRIELRGEHDEPVRWFDGKARRWRAFGRLGFRRLDKRGNVVTNQPYTDRQHSWAGDLYAGCE